MLNQTLFYSAGFATPTKQSPEMLNLKEEMLFEFQNGMNIELIGL